MFLSSAWVRTLIKYGPASNVSEVSDHLLREDSDINKNKQYAPLSPTSLGDWAMNRVSIIILPLLFIPCPTLLMVEDRDILWQPQ